ncbi:hypothetical protein HB852_09990 [Listeria grandensis]|uniref:phage regulatory protein/antirepressor Ant n=1 Tax=Listeria grandensis TaxID=1494963 RepID=UPI001624FF5D|nr:phage regulatory protein/antirepressor Ant [Listeria grandensis]MBC1474948.1 hypothetical protein [Listeria grandensis]
MPNLVVMKNEQAVTSSLQVAENFDKEHKHVLRDLDNLKGVVQNWTDLFYEDEYTHTQNKQQYRVIYMNRDGFTLLAMGFTGKKAMQFKLKYIEAFNQMENHIKQTEFEIPQTRAEALRLAADLEEENQQLKLVNTELKPKATYYDLVLQSKSLLSVTQIAKDYGMSAVAFNKKLHELGIQYKQGGTWHLYQKHAECGYTQSVTHVVDSEKLGTPLTKWTQQGRLFLYKELKEHGIVPNVEKGLLIEAEEM